MLKQNKGSRAYRIFDFLHRNIVIIIIAVVVIAGAVSTAAIVRGDASSGEKEENTVEYRPMNTVYFAMDRVRTLNPLASSDSDVYYISQLVYSSLFRLDETLNIQKDVVKDYETDSQDGSVKLNLRRDVKFSDGSGLTASDVSYTINKILSIGSESPYYHYVSKIDSVYQSGTYSLTVNFEDPKDAALDNLVFPIVSAADYSTDNEKCLGSGPYRLGSYEKTKSLKLSPNKYYYGQQAKNRIRFKIVADKNTTTGLMTMEAVTACVSRDQDADSVADDKDLKVTKIPSSEMEYLGFNCRNRILSDKRVRKAVAGIIDTEELIKDNYGGSGVLSDSIYFPGFLGTKNKGDIFGYDQKSALELLREAGYKDSNEDGVLENEKGKDLSLRILVDGSRRNRTDTARSIAESLRSAGLRVKLEVKDRAAFKEALAERDFDLYLGGYKFDKQYDLSSLFRKGGRTGYDNPEVRSLAGQLETCLSAEEQKTVYEKLKSVLADELPYYCLCYKTYAFVTVPEFTAEQPPVFFDIFRGCGNWQWSRTVTKEEQSDEADQ